MNVLLIVVVITPLIDSYIKGFFVILGRESMLVLRSYHTEHCEIKLLLW